MSLLKLHNSDTTIKPKWANVIFILVLMFIALFLSLCQKKSPDFNFILMTLDTQRWDFIGGYNLPNAAETPNLDSLAKKGMLFENCFCLLPTTLPSHANMFFSEYPHELGVYNNGQLIPAKDERPSFVQVLKEHGFTTAAFISLEVLKKRFGLAEGFDVYRDEFPKRRSYLTAEEVNENLLPWLEQNKGNKFFLWVHYSDPHEPYYVPHPEEDLKITHNGNLMGKFYLDRSYIFVYLDLQEGANDISFEVKNDFVQNPESPHATIDRIDIIEPQREQKVRIELKEGWKERLKEGSYVINKQGRMIIVNPAAPLKIGLVFRGKIVIPLEFRREQYRREVEYMDQKIGILLSKLKELNLDQKTDILIIGDHGEGLGEYMMENPAGAEHPHFGHTHYLYSVYTKIPLIIYRPNFITSEMKIKTPVTTLDVAPTIMNIMGFKNLRHFKGKNLLDIKNGSNRRIFQGAYEPLAIKNRFALLQYPWHLIFAPKDKKYELFNLEDDPYEKNDIFITHKEETLVIDMKQDLDSLARKVLKEKGEPSELDEESKEMLKSLGYIK